MEGLLENRQNRNCPSVRENPGIRMWKPWVLTYPSHCLPSPSHLRDPPPFPRCTQGSPTHSRSIGQEKWGPEQGLPLRTCSESMCALVGSGDRGIGLPGFCIWDNDLNHVSVRKGYKPASQIPSFRLYTSASAVIPRESCSLDFSFLPISVAWHLHCQRFVLLSGLFFPVSLHLFNASLPIYTPHLLPTNK